MTQTAVAAWLKQVAADTERAADKLIAEQPELPEAPLYAAMRYSLLAGGKRLRPALFFAALEAGGAAREQFLPWAVALEMIHTYSLIHDDLPAMDNDDLRRGRPTCHKAFGEDMAILAGDALLTQAFALMARPLPAVLAERQLRALRVVAEEAGLAGMVAGQAAECAALGQGMDEALLTHICRGKTSALFVAALCSGGLLAGVDEVKLAALREYAIHLGLAFQIVDDVLDVRGDASQLGKQTGMDAEKGLVTWVGLLGCAAAEQRAQQEAELACRALRPLGDTAQLLLALPALFVQRQQ